MTKAEKAVEYFQQHYSCSQAVFGPFAESLGMDLITAMKVAECFRGGMCTGDTCGAISGAYMAIGLKYGRTTPDDVEAKKLSGQVIAKFNEKFKEAIGDKKTCIELMGCDVRTPEGAAKSKEQNLREAVCVNAVRTAAQILEEIGVLK